MGLMDKVKEQAAVAMAKGEQAVVQGQAKVSEVQAKRAYDGLIKALGAAYYAQQRSGGSPAAVESALAAVDAHLAAHPGAEAAEAE